MMGQLRIPREKFALPENICSKHRRIPKEQAMKFTLTIFLFLAFTTTALAAREVVLVARDGKFEPETIEIQKDEKVELLVKNEGKEAEEFESHELHREKIIPPGKSVRIKIGPLKEGTYNFFGEFHPETAKGQIVVK
jgi:hypothetical protein